MEYPAAWGFIQTVRTLLLREPERNARVVLKRADEQTGADEQHQRQRDLRRDKEFLQARARAGAARRGDLQGGAQLQTWSIETPARDQTTGPSEWTPQW